MASINIRKLHGGEAAAILSHNHRHDGREGVVYGNEHIDPSKSHLNGILHWHGTPSRETAAEELARLRRRVEEIDKIEPPARIRKDRVTLVSVEIPVPEYLPPEEEKKFSKRPSRRWLDFVVGLKIVDPSKSTETRSMTTSTL